MLICSTVVSAGFFDWLFGKGLTSVTGNTITTCITDNDCPYGTFCFNEKCINSDNNEATLCSSHEDCPSLTPACINGVCLQCKNDEECGNGFNCIILTGECKAIQQGQMHQAGTNTMDTNALTDKTNPFNGDEYDIEAVTQLELTVESLNNLISNIELALAEGAKSLLGLFVIQMKNALVETVQGYFGRGVYEKNNYSHNCYDFTSCKFSRRSTTITRIKT